MSLDLKMAIAQVNPAVGDIPGNAEKVVAYAAEARKAGADIVVFPEQVVTGYPAQDLPLHPDFIRDVDTANNVIARTIEGITAIVGSVERVPRGPDGKDLQNVALVMTEGGIVGRQAKTLLPMYDVFHEPRYFTPAAAAEPVTIKGRKVGIQICEDMWDADYGRKVTKELVRAGRGTGLPGYHGRCVSHENRLHDLDAGRRGLSQARVRPERAELLDAMVGREVKMA